MQNSFNLNMQKEEDSIDPPEVILGERLFLETRFAQYFFSHSNGDVNAALSKGDPVVKKIITLGDPLPNPFSGKSINCRSCHLVDDLATVSGGGTRTYGDFARHSPIPKRHDKKHFTPRNSPPMVNAFLPRDVPFFLHFDGEFTTTEDLVKAGYTGRNFGWLPSEYNKAVAHFANVIRNDNGQGELATEYENLSYKTVLNGIDLNIPERLRIPSEYRIDVAVASDEQLLDACAKLVSAYLKSLIFSQDQDGLFNNAPYDQFLIKNKLPRVPNEGESNLAYSKRLLQLVEQIEKPEFVTESDGKFEFHKQQYIFGPLELEGLKIFLRQIADPDKTVQGIGNCVTCHPAPTFTDFKFHNTGATQEEYDVVHGEGSFTKLFIPNLKTRNANYDEYLPATSIHPSAKGLFRDIASAEKVGHTDLGVWNIFANPDYPKPQEGLKSLFCPDGKCSDKTVLSKTLATFKTPGLRDLGDSAPYLHTGRMDTIEDVLKVYLHFSKLARQMKVRNGDLELQNIILAENDIAPLAAFIRSLNEDYN